MTGKQLPKPDWGKAIHAEDCRFRRESSQAAEQKYEATTGALPSAEGTVHRLLHRHSRG
jgi:hypothetical protein